jgi:hypothetical protein
MRDIGWILAGIAAVLVVVSILAMFARDARPRSGPVVEKRSAKQKQLRG